jgi:hypothetical protein
MQNFQRDAVMRMEIAEGGVAYEPNSLAPDSPRENPRVGFTTFPAEDGRGKVRVRSESFADHYSQARLFWRSMSDPEQRHIVSAFSFELGKVGMVAIRRRTLRHLATIIEAELYKRVAEALGMEGQAARIQPARQPIDLKPSPALSLVQKAHAGGAHDRDTGIQQQRSDARRSDARGCREGGRPVRRGAAENQRRGRGGWHTHRRRPCARGRPVHLLRHRGPGPVPRGCAPTCA